VIEDTASSGILSEVAKAHPCLLHQTLQVAPTVAPIVLKSGISSAVILRPYEPSGVDVNEKNSKLESPLFLAVPRAPISVLQALLDCGT
jgi:hypothetical protein